MTQMNNSIFPATVYLCAASFDTYPLPPQQATAGVTQAEGSTGPPGADKNIDLSLETVPILLPAYYYINLFNLRF